MDTSQIIRSYVTLLELSTLLSIGITGCTSSSQRNERNIRIESVDEYRKRKEIKTSSQLKVIPLQTKVIFGLESHNKSLRNKIVGVLKEIRCKKFDFTDQFGYIDDLTHIPSEEHPHYQFKQYKKSFLKLKSFYGYVDEKRVLVHDGWFYFFGYTGKTEQLLCIPEELSFGITIKDFLNDKKFRNLGRSKSPGAGFLKGY